MHYQEKYQPLSYGDCLILHRYHGTWQFREETRLLAWREILYAVRRRSILAKLWGYGVYFVDSDCDWYSVSVPVVIYAICCYIGPHYNGPRLHISRFGTVYITGLCLNLYSNVIVVVRLIVLEGPLHLICCGRCSLSGVIWDSLGNIKLVACCTQKQMGLSHAVALY